jgi:hypothetical protein
MHDAVHARQDKEKLFGARGGMLGQVQVCDEGADAPAPDEDSLLNEALDGPAHGKARNPELGGKFGFGGQGATPLKTMTPHQLKQPELHLMVERDWTGSVDPHHRQLKGTSVSGST